MASQRICVCMIVKDEAAVIARCLVSLRRFVDCWCIVDTGSQDATMTLVRSTMGGMPGELHQRPWRNFAHNRNEALALGRALLHGLPPMTDRVGADYLMVIDADETLVLPAGFVRPPLTAAGYDLQMRYGDMRYARPSLLAADRSWQYHGVLHEYLECADGPATVPLAGPYVEVRPEGARSANPRKFHDDAALLERALVDEPENARYWFYLGQSWRDAGDPAKALDAYRRRAQLPGWEEKNWYALLQIARLSEQLIGKDLEAPQSRFAALRPTDDAASVRAAYELAYQRRPSRAETLVDLARWHRLNSRFAEALLWARAAAQIPLTTDRLFVEPAAYGWCALDEWSIAAFYCDCLVEGAQALRRLRDAAPPAAEMPRIRDNCGFYAAKGHKLW